MTPPPSTLPPQLPALLASSGLPELVDWTVLSGGYANDLFRLTLAGSPVRLVARCWRRDPGQAATELAVMRLAAEAVATPRVLAADLTGPRPLALIEDVPGMNAAEALSQFPGETGEIGAVLGTAFARLNRVKFGHPGLFIGPELRPLPWPESTPAQQLLDYAHPRLWNDVARSTLGPETANRLWELTERHAPPLNTLAAEAHLVHADANPKNVMVRRTPEGWQLAAVLDWEFAFSGASLTDLGNLLRFEPRQGSAYASGVVQGWKAGGGTLPEDGLALARTLDLYSLLEFVNRPEAALHREVALLLQRNAAHGRL